MSNRLWRAPTCALAATLLAAFTATAFGAEPEPQPEQQDVRSEMAKLPWQKGPATGDVSGHAKLAIPEGADLLPESSGARFLELTGNLPEPGETILVRHGHWWATLSYDESGYVKDDEKLDPDALLASMRSNEEESNKERKRRGMAELVNEGWIVAPHYDPKTKFLEWGVKLRASDSPQLGVNYSMRLLSRHGYENVVLVTSPETLDADVQDLRQVLAGFNFNAGETYSEFRPGDHVAEFGLGALVLGGAAAAAVKAGWFKGLLVALAAGWKFVVAAAVAGVGALRKIFGGKSGAK
jgi:uncharacterized membrane-anchored protein